MNITKCPTHPKVPIALLKGFGLLAISGVKVKTESGSSAANSKELMLRLLSDIAHPPPCLRANTGVEDTRADMYFS